MKKLFLILLLLAGSAFGQPLSSSDSKIIGADGTVANVKRGAIETLVQDQFTRALDLRFIMSVGAPTTLASDTVVDAHTIILTSAAGFVDGSYIVIAEAGNKFYVGTQLGAPAGNVITLDSPLDQIYDSGTAVVLNTTYNMAVNGSVTPKVFQISSSSSTIVMDITRFLGYLQSATTMDDSKFGGIAALTNGCVLQISDGVNTNVWNIKTNADLALLGFDFNYTDKAPAGSYGARFRITYAGRAKHGVTIRLYAGYFVKLIIQDDLTNLEIFNMMAQGHEVE